MASRVDDRYERYFTEKLWAMIPELYRNEDGLATRPNVLRSILELLANEAAQTRRGHDRLWDDAFIELCDNWAVPYIGDLLGTRLLGALNKRGRRVDVGKTIYYRRRKGTPRVLEELASDIAGWDGVVVEEFRRLSRTRHGLDPKPGSLAGRFTRTGPAGWADLRDPRGAHLMGGPFEEYSRTVDVRRHSGEQGRFNIPKVAFHLYRLGAHPIEGVVPFASVADAGAYTFDPSGRKVPLFMRRDRPVDWDEWTAARPWQLPAPMTCRLLNHAEYELREELIESLVAAGLSNAGADDLRSLLGVHFREERLLDRALGQKTSSVELLGMAVHDRVVAGAMVEDCAKHALLPGAVAPERASVAVAPDGATEVPREHIVAGNIDGVVAVPTGKQLVIFPDQGRFRANGIADPTKVRVRYVYGFGGDLGAGAYQRSDLRAATRTLPPTADAIAASDWPMTGTGTVRISRSATFHAVADVAGVVDLCLQSADRTRPYLRLAGDWTITAKPAIEALLELDGLWLGSPGAHAIVLKGTFARVTIRRSTLDPGGANVDAAAIPSLPLFVEGIVRELVIASSITAAVGVRSGGEVEMVTIEDSIVDAPAAASALTLPQATVVLRRVTIFGALTCDKLDASDSLVDGVVTVTDTQDGCFRFSAALDSSRVPHRYESFLYPHMSWFFTSRRFGDPGYGQLAEEAPLEVAQGGENGSEMGAMSSLLWPIRARDLAKKVDEYLPFGLVPIFVLET
jgi:hypothetical protein